ncbi:LysR family transcriptional regulator [Simiduia sp. 21SJ11W-1]|uniref:LysR family transcriptional regulator n=1 Tax=Simiduia sp. 21SJ11W-1 TaxID=2909669 RepID=UPI0020A0BDB5|nr:LysR family transcriptional regulator [Simiduia sp. 21SJ11W-1]UTA48386.1 LysR family transcriptional regulator [Simiduia sp. 21SJ11W-1]
MTAKQFSYLAPEQLEAFEVTARVGSFSAAARQLGKAQSTISGLINNLEIDTGLELFDRSRREPMLTEHGQSLLNDVRAVMNAFNRLDAKTRSLTAGVEDSLTLAIDEAAISQGQLSATLAAFSESFQTVKLQIILAPESEPAALIKSGQADLGLMLASDDYPEEFEFKGIGTTYFEAVVGAAHPLAQLSEVSAASLRDHLHLRIGARNSTAKAASDFSHRVWQVDNHHQLIELVRQGLGWASAPSHLVQRYLANGSLVKLPTSYQLTPFPHGVDLIWPQSRTLGHATRWLIDALAKQVSS